MAIDYVSIDVRVKLSDSRSNGSHDIRGADFVSNERANMTKLMSMARKTSQAFRIKITKLTISYGACRIAKRERAP